jgi:hypothetical protein
VKRQWELAGTINSALEKPVEDGPGPTTIATAIGEFQAGYIQAEMAEGGTARKYTTVLNQLTRFVDDKGYRFVKELGLAELQAFQTSWKMGAPRRRQETGAHPDIRGILCGPRLHHIQPGQ